MAVPVDIIPLDSGGVVIKKGLKELVLRGEVVGRIVGPLTEVVHHPVSAPAVLASLDADDVDLVEHALSELQSRGLLPDAMESDGVQVLAPDESQEAFYEEFGSPGAEAASRLAAASVTVVGANAISLAAVTSLASMGLGSINVIHDPGLSNLDPQRFIDVGAAQVSDEVGGGDIDLIIATSDVGAVDLLLDVNRAVLDSSTPFLPAWIANLQCFAGPLVHPRESPCLRCAVLRMDSNDGSFEANRSVRAHMSRTAAGRVPAALGPMQAVLGNIVAMETAKFIGGWAPADVLGRSIQLNLVSFRAHVSRVLKVPRCPDCSDLMMRSPEVIILGPQIYE